MLVSYRFGMTCVFIHRSIKTRIETLFQWFISREYNHVFIHRSIKTRIETLHLVQYFRYPLNVFIHRSIKTRIETQYFSGMRKIGIMFLYIDPLKQGLKHSKGHKNKWDNFRFYT